MEHFFGGFPAAKLGGADGSAPGGELLLLVVDGLAELEQLSAIVRGKNLPVKARLLLDIRRNVRQLRKTGKLRQKRLHVRLRHDRADGCLAADGGVDHTAAVIGRKAIIVPPAFEPRHIQPPRFLHAAHALDTVNHIIARCKHRILRFPQNPTFCILIIADFLPETQTEKLHKFSFSKLYSMFIH